MGKGKKERNRGGAGMEKWARERKGKICRGWAGMVKWARERKGRIE